MVIKIEDKIAISACSGMSPNGLISRVVSDDLSNDENIVSLCIGATSGDRPGLLKLIKKYPIIAINGCDGGCVNTILKDKGVDVVDFINIEKELKKIGISSSQVSRLDADGEECVEKIKEIVLKKVDLY